MRRTAATTETTMKRQDWAGVIPAITTPFTPELELDLDFFAEHARWMIGAGCTGIVTPGSLGEGWLERFGIDAAIHEFNCQWIAKLNEHPSARHWKDYGASLAVVFDRYFATQKAH